MEIKTVAVIGAGQMGRGIAHVVALAGIDVVLIDRLDDNSGKALAEIATNLDRQIKRDKITPEQKRLALAHINTSVKFDALDKADLVIEAVTEDEAVKTTLYAQLCPFLAPHALLATNTSSIPITRLASASDRPGRFIGMHFMNPVPVMELVELIRGIATEDETFAIAEDFVKRLGKLSAVSEDSPAFVVNRVLIPMINEAICALHEGVGDVLAIDRAMRFGAHHPMGPLELADFIGLDTCLSIMQMLYDGFADTKYRPCPLLVKYVDAGWIGRKSGRGFYDYTGLEPKPTR